MSGGFATPIRSLGAVDLTARDVRTVDRGLGQERVSSW
jgi:hypothetical protein